MAVDAKARVAQLTGFRSITAAAEFPAAFGCFSSWLKARLCAGWGPSSARMDGGNGTGLVFRRGRSQTGPREGQFPIPSVSLRSTSSLPLLAYGHFPLIGGIGPLIRGVVPSPTGFKKAFWGWVGEPLGAPVGGVRAKKSPSSVWPSGQPPSPWKGEGLSGRVWDPPLRRITKTVSRLRRGRSQTGPPGFAPGALAEKTQAQLWNRTGGNFCKPRAQWPGRNRGKPLRFCAPEILQDLTGTRPP